MKRQDLELLRQWHESGKEALGAQLQPETLNEDDRTIDVVWFTGIDVPRYDWRRDEPYVLRFDPAGLDLSRLNNGAPVADNHHIWSSMDQLGVVAKAWAERQMYKATLRFSKRESLNDLWGDIRDKIVTKFSMGVELLEIEEQKRKEGEPLVKLVKNWRPFEISVAPLPADFGTTTLSADQQQPGEQAQPVILGARTREVEVLRLRGQ